MSDFNWKCVEDGHNRRFTPMCPDCLRRLKAENESQAKRIAELEGVIAKHIYDEGSYPSTRP